MTPGPQLVIFDLDGTLTRRDTLIPYLSGFLVRHPWRIFRTLHLPVVLAMFFLGFISHARLKEYFLTAFLGGATREQIQQWSSTFIEKLRANGLRERGLKALKAHIASSDHTVLLSASLDFYVNELGTELGFDKVICTSAEWSNDRLTGRLASANHRGQEKVRQLELLKSSFPDTYITAYADNDSDLELLRSVDNGILINARRKTRARARSLKINLQHW